MQAKPNEQAAAAAPPAQASSSKSNGSHAEAAPVAAPGPIAAAVAAGAPGAPIKLLRLIRRPFVPPYIPQPPPYDINILKTGPRLPQGPLPDYDDSIKQLLKELEKEKLKAAKLKEVSDYKDKKSDEDECKGKVSPFDPKPQLPIKATDQILLSTYEQACDPNFVRDNNIAYVFSFLKEVPSERHCPDTVYYHFDCERNRFSDLISHFDSITEILDWIVVTKRATVLLHCDGTDYAICSTFVAAYFLLKGVDNWRLDMLDLKVMPHPVFFEQLELFERMGKRCDPFHSQYRIFVMCALNWECCNVVRQLKAPAALYELASIMKLFRDYIEKMRQDADTKAVLDQQCAYHCIDCEAYLFNELNVVKGGDLFAEPPINTTKKLKSHKTIRDVNDSLGICNKYYIEPMEWMFWSEDSQPICTIIGANQITCRECGSVLGIFHMLGSNCPTRWRDKHCSKHPDSKCCMFEIDPKSIYALKANQPNNPVQLNPLPAQQTEFNLMMRQPKEKALREVREKRDKEKRDKEKPDKEKPDKEMPDKEMPRNKKLVMYSGTVTPSELSQGTSWASSRLAGPEQHEPMAYDPMEGSSSSG